MDTDTNAGNGRKEAEAQKSNGLLLALCGFLRTLIAARYTRRGVTGFLIHVHATALTTRHSSASILSRFVARL
jgi:hypothetical protein